VDLSAFALIRSLYRPDPEQTGRVLYLNVDGLTNLAIAEGTICRFTRVVGSGLEGMAGELAERRSIAVTEARALLAAVDLTASARVEPAIVPPEAEAEPLEPTGEPASEQATSDGEEPQSREDADESEREMSYEEMTAVEEAPAPGLPTSDADIWAVLENGIRDISGEVRNSLDFHRSQDGGGEVSHVVMSGSAQDIPGFAEALQSSLGVEVRCGEVGLTDEQLAETVAPHRLAVAAGLAATEAPR
jgi:type IV pilus assembly protein PilM